MDWRVRFRYVICPEPILGVCLGGTKGVLLFLTRASGGGGRLFLGYASVSGRTFLKLRSSLDDTEVGQLHQDTLRDAGLSECGANRIGQGGCAVILQRVM